MEAALVAIESHVQAAMETLETGLCQLRLFDKDQTDQVLSPSDEEVLLLVLRLFERLRQVDTHKFQSLVVFSSSPGLRALCQLHSDVLSFARIPSTTTIGVRMALALKLVRTQCQQETFWGKLQEMACIDQDLSTWSNIQDSFRKFASSHSVRQASTELLSDLVDMYSAVSRFIKCLNTKPEHEALSVELKNWISSVNLFDSAPISSDFQFPRGCFLQFEHKLAQGLLMPFYQKNSSVLLSKRINKAFEHSDNLDTLQNDFATAQSALKHDLEHVLSGTVCFGDAEMILQLDSRTNFKLQTAGCYFVRSFAQIVQSVGRSKEEPQ